MRLVFADRLAFDVGETGVKSGLSMRDGVVLYAGAELGMEPADKMFTVYRSPATVANAAMALVGVPLTDGHQEPEGEVLNPKGRVVGTEMVEFLDPQTASTLAVRNAVEIDSEFLPVVSDPAGPRELSLGYKADLVPHTEWDFEQVGFAPHHLAVVPAGRCGPVCSFVDHNTREVEAVKFKDSKTKKLHKAFADENGDVNITEVVEIANQLPEALKEMPLEKLRELIPILQEAVKGADTTLVENGEESMLDAGEDPSKKTEDEAAAAKKFEDAVSKKAQKLIDTALETHVAVIGKARDFVDEDYSFAGKKTAQIMRDVLATQSAEKFADAELPLAFKMLRKAHNPALTDFGDGASDDKWASFGSREVK